MKMPKNLVLLQIIWEKLLRLWEKKVGYDADTFTKNATTYLEDLKTVKAALIETAGIVQNRNKKYSSRIEEYFDKIKYRGDNKNEQ